MLSGAKLVPWDLPPPGGHVTSGVWLVAELLEGIIEFYLKFRKMLIMGPRSWTFGLQK